MKNTRILYAVAAAVILATTAAAAMPHPAAKAVALAAAALTSLAPLTCELYNRARRNRARHH